MKIIVYYGNGNSVVLDCVQMLRLVGPRTLGVQCFGNDEVLHRNVIEFKVQGGGFNFEALPAASMR